MKPMSDRRYAITWDETGHTDTALTVAEVKTLAFHNAGRWEGDAITCDGRRIGTVARLPRN